MFTCTDCVHYNACKFWADSNAETVKLLNEGFERMAQTLGCEIEHINNIGFPLVAETKEELCFIYEKAKVK